MTTKEFIPFGKLTREEKRIYWLRAKTRIQTKRKVFNLWEVALLAQLLVLKDYNDWLKICCSD